MMEFVVTRVDLSWLNNEIQYMIRNENLKYEFASELYKRPALTRVNSCIFPFTRRLLWGRLKAIMRIRPLENGRQRIINWLRNGYTRPGCATREDHGCMKWEESVAIRCRITNESSRAHPWWPTWPIIINDHEDIYCPAKEKKNRIWQGRYQLTLLSDAADIWSALQPNSFEIQEGLPLITTCQHSLIKIFHSHAAPHALREKKNIQFFFSCSVQNLMWMWMHCHFCIKAFTNFKKWRGFSMLSIFLRSFVQK